MNLQNSYLGYLKDSLGIEDVILPTAPVAATEAALTNALAFFIHSPSATLSIEAKDLLSKMTQAMGRALDRIPVKTVKESYEIDFSPQTVNVFFTSDENAQDLGRWSADGLTMTTYSPELLLQKPSFKKATWAHLQEVMRKLNQ